MRKIFIGITWVLAVALSNIQAIGQDRLKKENKASLVYENALSSKEDVKDWIMEGPGNIEFNDNWMHLQSPGEKGHFVFWCPVDFPSGIIVEWEAQNIEPDAGLCIVFFAAKGKHGESIFDSSFPKRDGKFKQYTKSKHLNNYHISYYANTKDARAKEVTHLRKNSGFHKVQEGEAGIPLNSTAVHKMELIKNGAHISMFVDERKIIDWIDEGKEYGPVLEEGTIGLRQMKWTHFKYRNFKVWEIGNNNSHK